MTAFSTDPKAVAQREAKAKATTKRIGEVGYRQWRTEQGLSPERGNIEVNWDKLNEVRKRSGKSSTGPVSAKELARARVAALNKNRNRDGDTVIPGSRGGSSYSRSTERNSPNVSRDQYATPMPRLDQRSTGNRRFKV